MKLLHLSLLLGVTTCSVCVAQQDNSFDPGSYATETEARQRDFEALQEFIKTKRAITVKEKGGNLMISGDIRGEWYYMHARTNDKPQRGWASRKRFPNSFVNRNSPPVTPEQFSKMTFDQKVTQRQKRNAILPPFGRSEFDAEANLVFDYVAERGWGTIRLQLSNPAGVTEIDRKAMINDNRRVLWGSGRLNDLALRKCFAGYNFWEQGTSRFDMEIGRRRLYDVFDSKIEFWSYFDGILARFTTSYDDIADFYVKGGAFVVDSNVNHYGYVGELGLLNMLDSGVNFKYSIIDWDTHDRPNRYGLRHSLGNKFVNSQFLLSYDLPPDLISQKTTIYGAYLINAAAKKTWWTYHRRANNAFYAGARYGEAIRKGDYSVEWFYQWVQAQAIPERDVSSSARDNPRRVSFYNRRWGGFANFKGWRLEGFYALTDNWTLNAHFDDIRQLDHNIGGFHRSYEFYLGAIFAF